MKTDKELKAGMLVRHPGKSEWGLGKILTLASGVACVHFKDDHEEYRKFRLSDVRLEIADVQSDPVLERLQSFGGDRFNVSAKWVSFPDSVKRFTELFPLGFKDSSYLDRERNYKLQAHQRFVGELGGGRGESLLRNGAIGELTKRAHSVASQELNLLSVFELLALRDGLKGDERAASKFFAALFDMLSGEPDRAPFENYVRALSDLPAEDGKARVATWPNLTLLPYLARPDRFMFLKPGPTQECAKRRRFDLQYKSELNWITYSNLLAFSNDLLAELRVLGAKDFIDVQSFMWVIAKY